MKNKKHKPLKISIDVVHRSELVISHVPDEVMPGVRLVFDKVPSLNTEYVFKMKGTKTTLTAYQNGKRVTIPKHIKGLLLNNFPEIPLPLKGSGKCVMSLTKLEIDR
jgi:hypothetical protein